MLPHLSPQPWAAVDDFINDNNNEERTADDIRSILTESNGTASVYDQPELKSLLNVRAGEIVYVLSKK